MKLRAFFSVILLVLSVTSCQLQEDRVIPFAEPKKISEIQQAILEATNGKDFQASSMSYHQVEGDKEHFYLKLKYKIDKVTSEDLKNANQSLAQASKSLLSLFAKIFFALGGEYDVVIPDVTFEIPELNYDKEVIKDIIVSNIHLEFYDDKKDQNFNFIKELDILTPGKMGNELILSYDKRHSKCQHKCLEFELYKPSLTEIIGDKKEITVKTNLKIDKLPKKIDLKFKGYVELFIKLKMPF